MSHLPQQKFSIEPLMRLADCTEAAEYARTVGISIQHIYRYQKEGVTAPIADRLAVAQGLDPYAVWGDEWRYGTIDPVGDGYVTAYRWTKLANLTKEVA